jgi:4-hydroxymandelate synthase
MHATVVALELWVSDLERTWHHLRTRFGFRPAADLHIPHSPDDRVLAGGNGGVRVVLRQGRSVHGRVARHVAQHGDTVGDVVVACASPQAVAARARAAGLAVTIEQGRPAVDLLADGTMRHSLVPFGTHRFAPAARDQLVAIDHIAYCVPVGYSDRLADAYEEVFGLVRSDTDSFDSVDGPGGMRGTVLRSDNLVVVLTEPQSLAAVGQTQRFLDAHGGPGVQHAAVACADLPAVVEEFAARGARFLPVQRGYYDDAARRDIRPPVGWERLRELGILVDGTEDAVLMQLFTEPLSGGGQFFFELIQRSGATGFGANNVRALFAAVEASTADVGDTVPGLGRW